MNGRQLLRRKPIQLDLPVVIEVVGFDGSLGGNMFRNAELSSQVHKSLTDQEVFYHFLIFLNA